MTEKEKVVPSASVGADAGRPIPYEPESSIAETELPDKQNFSETLREFKEFVRKNDPDQIRAVTLKSSCERTTRIRSGR